MPVGLEAYGHCYFDLDQAWQKRRENVHGLQVYFVFVLCGLWVFSTGTGLDKNFGVHWFWCKSWIVVKTDSRWNRPTPDGEFVGTSSGAGQETGGKFRGPVALRRAAGPGILVSEAYKHILRFLRRMLCDFDGISA